MPRILGCSSPGRLKITPSLSSQAERPQRFPVHGELFKAGLLVELLQALEEGEVPWHGGRVLATAYIDILAYHECPKTSLKCFEAPTTPGTI